MQWHRGNIGSFLAGLSTLVIAVAALIRSPAALRDWQARQRAQAEVAHEQAENLRLERRRGLSGWSKQGVNTYPVELVAQVEEFRQLILKDYPMPSDFVILRVTGNSEGARANLANQLGQTVKAEGCLSRPPSIGEVEALAAGLDAPGIPAAAFGRGRPDGGR